MAIGLGTLSGASEATPGANAGAAILPTGRVPPPALPNLQLPPNGFLESSDKLILDRLIQGQVSGIKKGSGGRSLGFKLSFSDDTRAYFKPAQSFSGAIWYAEVAAYHLDRVLGMRRVPPVISYRTRWAPLAAAAGSDRRRSEVQVNEDGTVNGALVYWLPQKLQRAITPPGWENWIRVARYSRRSITPYQRPSRYTAALERRRTSQQRAEPGNRYFRKIPPQGDPELAPALSDMLVLDFLTLNIDRWGGKNGNVLCYGDRVKALIFLDNGAGFSHGPHLRGLMDDRLAVQQKFRRSTVDALRAFKLSAFEHRLAGEALAPILSPRLLRGVQVRRDALIAHVNALIDKHGEDAVLAWN